MYEGMFYIGMFFGVLNFGISIILFVKNHVASMVRDLMGWNRSSKPINDRRQNENVFEEKIKIASIDEEEKPDRMQNQKITDVLTTDEVCVEQFFLVEEDIVVTHTEKRM